MAPTTRSAISKRRLTQRNLVVSSNSFRRRQQQQQQRRQPSPPRSRFLHNNNGNNNDNEVDESHQQQDPQQSLSQDEYFQALSARPLPPTSSSPPPRATRAKSKPLLVQPPPRNQRQPPLSSQQQSSSDNFIQQPARNEKLPSMIQSQSMTSKTIIKPLAPAMTTSSAEQEATSSETADAVSELLQSLTDPSWKLALHDAIHSSSFQQLALFLHAERRQPGTVIYPPLPDTFAALNKCPLDSVKVVIVGQDPYHGPNQGHGLAFSVRRGIRPPPSLLNIFKEAGIPKSSIPHGNLEYWAQQGVLLLNTVLTVRQGHANSHANRGWEEFTDAVMDVLNRQTQRPLVFLLWGNPAHKKAKTVDATRHTIICTSHPSPLGATKTSAPFLGSNCFPRANEALQQAGLEPVDWTLPE